MFKGLFEVIQYTVSLTKGLKEFSKVWASGRPIQVVTHPKQQLLRGQLVILSAGEEALQKEADRWLRASRR